MANLGMIELSFILLGVMILLLASGVWIAVALGLVGFVAMALTTSLPLGTVLATTTWSASASWTLAALPLFIWMGEILFAPNCRRKCSAACRPGFSGSRDG